MAKSKTPKESTVTTTVSVTPIADPLTARLLELGVDQPVIDKIKTDLGAATVEDLVNLTEADLTGAGMKLIPARNLLKALVPAPTMPVNTVSSVVSLDALPPLPDDASWLAALKIGGVLKFSRETVVGTVSAALASRVGLYDLPKRLVSAMEENAESLDEPVTADFFEMQRMLTERSYAEIFAAIPGATGRFATQGRKDELLKKMNLTLWTSLISFQDQLNGWMENWKNTFSNPMAMFGAMAAINGGGIMPAGMMTPPPTDTLRDAAEGVITSINGIFAGTGIIVAMALAYDAQQIRKALETPNLPSQVGALNREQMLKKLGVAVSSDYPRLEVNLKRFTLGIIELPNITAGQTELNYVVQLQQLGAMIPWGQLGAERTGKLSGIGSGSTRRGEL